MERFSNKKKKEEDENIFYEGPMNNGGTQRVPGEFFFFISFQFSHVFHVN